MTKYTAELLEKRFRQVAISRIKKAGKGDNRYTGDADYWTGGACNWGGSHNLAEDCRTLERFIQKIDDLKTAGKELKESTSKEEFEATKSRLIRQAQEAENNLQSKTSANTSIGGICIIWENYISFIERQLKPLRSEVKTFKEQLRKEEYKYIEELKLLKLEQKQIEQKMDENKRKAADLNISPEEKAALLLLIDDDGELLKANLKKQKQIPTTNLKFEPDKYVDDLIEAMKKAVEKGNKNPRNRGGNRNPHSTSDNNSDSDDDSEENNSDDDNLPATNPEENNNQSKDWFQENKQLIIISAGLSLLFYLYSQNDEEEAEYPTMLRKKEKKIYQDEKK